MGHPDRVPCRPFGIKHRAAAIQPPDMGLLWKAHVAQSTLRSIAIPSGDHRRFCGCLERDSGTQLVKCEPADEIGSLVRPDIAEITAVSRFRDQEIEQDFTLRGEQGSGPDFAGFDRIEVGGDQVLEKMSGVSAIHLDDVPVGKDQGWHGAALRDDWALLLWGQVGGHVAAGKGGPDQSPAMKKRHSPSGEIPTR